MGQVRRRQFLVAASGLLASPFARAQPRKPLTLGLLYPNPGTGAQGTAHKFFSGILKKLGWSVGTDLVLIHASAEGHEDRLPALAEDLVKKRVDVIWAAGPEAAVAAVRATKTTPIAFYGVGYPVEQGLIESLSRPGRNVTGLASLASIGHVKLLEVLKEIAPHTQRVAWIAVETVVETVAGDQVRLTEGGIVSAAPRLGFEVRKFPVSKAEDFDVAFGAIVDARSEAIIADFTALTYRERHRIAEFAIREKLPVLFGTKVFVEAGALASYGADRAWMIEYSFVYVDRILRGAQPADLPVELPSKLELAVNRKTAEALGLTIPPAILLRADRVVE